MKNLPGIALVAVALATAGCSKHSASMESTSPPAIDLVQAGKDAAFAEGITVHVTKRDGANVEGVRVLMPQPDGQTNEITADRGSIEQGADGNSFENQVTLTLRDAKVVSSKGTIISPTVKIVLHD